MKKAVAFIVRAVGEKTQVLSCLNSIYRQRNKAFEVVAITDIEDFAEELESKYNGISVISVKKKNFLSVANQVIRELETEYFVYANADSVYTPNTVDEILKDESDCVIFNISRISNKKFIPLCSGEKEFTFEQYIKLGACIWNNAVRTRFAVDNNLYIKKMEFFEQLFYLLELYSLAGRIRMVQQVLVYREKMLKAKEITFKQFYGNRKVLKKIVVRFNKKGMYTVSKKIIADFVFDNMDGYYMEKNFFRKMRIRHIIREYICM